MLNKTHRTKENFKEFYTLLKKIIKIIPKKEIEPFLKEAMDISPDPKDTIYLALSLAIKSKFWSSDKKLKEEQNLVEILTTEEILQKVKDISNKE